MGVFHGIADRKSVGKLEALGTSVVEVGGKTNIPLAHAILTSLGIPTHSLFDSDAGFEARARNTGKTESAIEKERVGHVAANRDLMSYFGLFPEDFPGVIESVEVTILADHLEELIMREWPEWGTACKKIEEEAGVVLRKNEVGYRAATLSALGQPCPLLERVLDRTRG